MVKDNKTYCNICGKEFDDYDIAENRHASDVFRCGSNYQGQHFNIDICAGCFDRFVEFINDNAEYPIIIPEAIIEQDKPEEKSE